jgi:pilus assembly protein Flp/PilA
MKEMLKRLVVEESGQGMTEYALILALVSIGAIAALILMKDQIVAVFDTITGKLSAEVPPAT